MIQMKSDIKISTNAQDWITYLNGVAENTQIDIDNQIPKLRTNTRKKVKSYLKKGSGVDEGIYKKSFIINNFAESKWHIGFQVFAKKPHYRLTHLLEDGHEVWVFRRGGGRKTKWGNFGMVLLNKTTKKIPHIAPSQEYAEDKIKDLYEETINKNLGRMKK